MKCRVDFVLSVPAALQALIPGSNCFHQGTLNFKLQMLPSHSGFVVRPAARKEMSSLAGLISPDHQEGGDWQSHKEGNEEYVWYYVIH